MITLFLLAHQDDEIGLFDELSEAKRRGEHVACVYLTNGAWGGVTSERRNAESRKTLGELGLMDAEITFLGTDLTIPDGRLIEHLDRCFEALLATVARLANADALTRIVMHAWEGGHQDHDAAHIIGLALADRLGIVPASRQFPLYRMPAGRWSMTFAKPLAANGPVEIRRIATGRRMSYLRLLANYRSQRRVIAKLFPHIVNHYVREGTQQLQPVSIARIYQAPNTPPMLYEKWGLYSYSDFRRYADAFIARHLSEPRALRTAPEGPV